MGRRLVVHGLRCRSLAEVLIESDNCTSLEGLCCQRGFVVGCELGHARSILGGQP